MTTMTTAAAACAGTIALACAVIPPANAADFSTQPRYSGPPVEENYVYQEQAPVYRYAPQYAPAPPQVYYAPPRVVVVPEPYYVAPRRVYVDPGYGYGYGAYAYGYRPYVADGYGYRRGWGWGHRRW